LETDASGRTVTGVVAQRRDGQRETYRADLVVVACGAINSALLLLDSANDRHPNGLANSSDVVGPNYMCHLHSALRAISRTPTPPRPQKALGVTAYYWGGGGGFDSPRGHIQMLGKSDGTMLKAGPPWYAQVALALDYIARHAVDFWVTTEDLPQA